MKRNKTSNSPVNKPQETEINGMAILFIVKGIYQTVRDHRKIEIQQRYKFLKENILELRIP